MDQAEIDQFVTNGQGALTVFAAGAEAMQRWAASFEQRGGGDVFGEDATQIVYLTNDLMAFLTPERRATIARLRTDV